MSLLEFQSYMTAMVRQEAPSGIGKIDFHWKVSFFVRDYRRLDHLYGVYPKETQCGGTCEMFAMPHVKDEMTQLRHGGLFVIPVTLNLVATTPPEMLDRMGVDSEDDFRYVVRRLHTIDNPYYQTFRKATELYGWDRTMTGGNEWTRRLNSVHIRRRTQHFRGYQKFELDDEVKEMKETGWFANDAYGAVGHKWWEMEPSPSLAVHSM